MTGKLCTFSTFEFWRLRTNSRTARRQFSTGVNSVPGFSKNHTVTNAIFVDADCSASERSPARRVIFIQLAVGRSCRIQNSFYLETKHRGPIIFPPCGHVIFSIFCVKQPKYANISRFTDCRKPYILPLSIGLWQIDPFDRQYTVIILRSLSRSQCRRRNCY